MKKIYKLAIIATVLLVLPVLFMNRLSANSDQISETKVPENRTIKIYAELLKDSTEEEVDAYFRHSDDNDKIIAYPGGGYLTSPDGKGFSQRFDKDGNEEILFFEDDSVSATIREIKEYLKEQREQQ
ncbi:hypothetical protein [Streptococcus marmotae]|uniref:hypothetical protein n=1 Tax=Streptococcus marmotae TaxID=1825069 RepID=UPI00083766A4|nr:hypothetical protein [Streptococcus marmotae]